MSTYSSKILSWDEAQQWAQHHKDAGYELVFTNGCFDILHVGHTTYLSEAKAQGDFLIVGLNSDASVSRLKGSRRPIQSAEDRATILAALTCVDAVVVFEEDTPAELIALILPDILVKGGDYKEENIVGGDIVKAHGGIVKCLSFVEGRSTSSILSKM